MHAITPHIEFEHIKGKENVLADSLSRLRHFGLHDDNGAEDQGQEYGKFIFGTGENMINNLDSEQNLNNKFKIDGKQYILNKSDLDSTSTNSLTHACNFDLEKLKQ